MFLENTPTYPRFGGMPEAGEVRSTVTHDLPKCTLPYPRARILHASSFVLHERVSIAFVLW
jgi:hypothetical protein